MNNLKNYIQFNEMADWNDTMTIEDLIYVLEQKPKDNFIVAMNEKLSRKDKNGEIYFLLNDFVKIPSEGKKMKSENYSHNFSSRSHDFYTHNIETNPANLLGLTYIGDKERPEETNLPPYKTIGQLIEIAKTIPNPGKSLFFIPRSTMLYDSGTMDNSYSSVRGLATRNITSYPLTKNGVIVSGKIGEDYDFGMDKRSEDAANQFMSMGGESGGHYYLA
tara:strand:+ start:1421 stop:2077 length:657 start_codon:yes stop_codon:yes gene_type:complete